MVLKRVRPLGVIPIVVLKEESIVEILLLVYRFLLLETF